MCVCRSLESFLERLSGHLHTHACTHSYPCEVHPETGSAVPGRGIDCVLLRQESCYSVALAGLKFSVNQAGLKLPFTNPLTSAFRVLGLSRTHCHTQPSMVIQACWGGKGAREAISAEGFWEKIVPATDRWPGCQSLFGGCPPCAPSFRLSPHFSQNEVRVGWVLGPKKEVR